MKALPWILFVLIGGLCYVAWITGLGGNQVLVSNVKANAAEAQRTLAEEKERLPAQLAAKEAELAQLREEVAKLETQVAEIVKKGEEAKERWKQALNAVDELQVNEGRIEQFSLDLEAAQEEIDELRAKLADEDAPARAAKEQFQD